MTKLFIILIVISIIIAYKRSKRVRYITHVNNIEFVKDLNDSIVFVTNSEKGSMVKKLTFKPGSELKIYVNVGGFITLKYLEPQG